MNRCKLIEDITNKIINGGDADKIIPYDIKSLPNDMKMEMIGLYLKYGKDERRKEECRNALKWLEDEARR